MAERLPALATLASDADRERCQRALRAAHAEGRMDHDALEERMEIALRARTRGELRRATRGLPTQVPRPRPGLLRKAHRVALGLHATAYVGGNGAAIGVWAALGEGLFWPAVLLVPTTGLLAAHAAGGPLVRRAWRKRRGDRSRARS